MLNVTLERNKIRVRDRVFKPLSFVSVLENNGLLSWDSSREPRVPAASPNGWGGFSSPCDTLAVNGQEAPRHEPFVRDSP